MNDDERVTIEPLALATPLSCSQARIHLALQWLTAYKRKALTTVTLLSAVLFLTFFFHLAVPAAPVSTHLDGNTPQEGTATQLADGTLSISWTSGYLVVSKAATHQVVWRGDLRVQSDVVNTNGILCFLTPPETVEAERASDGMLLWTRLLPLALPVMAHIQAYSSLFYIILRSGFSQAETLFVVSATDGFLKGSQTLTEGARVRVQDGHVLVIQVDGTSHVFV